jgi:dihydrolipoamide dehydrogenase
VDNHVDNLVIGGGPGGYVAAIRLGQLGRETMLVERETLGGVCINVGCIPSKAMVRAAKLMKDIRRAKDFGIETSQPRMDLQKLQIWKKSVVDKLTQGVAYLCKANKVSVVHGEARFRGPHQVEIKSKEGSEVVNTDNVIIATGSRPVEIPGFKFDGKFVITATEALSFSEVPRDFVIIGAGVSGLELGTAYAEFGSHVTVIEMLDQLLPGTDIELVRVIERTLKRLGVETHLKARAKWAKDGKVSAQLADGKEIEVPADKVMVVVGRRPNSDEIGLENVGVKMDQTGFVQVDRQMQTNVPGIYAIGDVVGQPLLAHKASKQGIVAAEVIAGEASAADFKAMPSAVWTSPEIATVGLTEAEAKKQGYKPIVGKFLFTALGRAAAAGETDGFMKVVADKESERILGVHMVGDDVTNLISEAALAIEMGATLDDVALTVHPHPTLPEALMEAAEAARGKPIHMVVLTKPP